MVDGRRDGQTIYYGVKGREVKTVLETLHALYCAQGKPNGEADLDPA